MKPILDFINDYINESYSINLLNKLVQLETDEEMVKRLSYNINNLSDDLKGMLSETFNSLSLKEPKTDSQQVEQDSLLYHLDIYAKLLVNANRIQIQYLKEVLLKELNGKQQLACIHKDGPMLLSAGPGSGKTRTITYRISTLMNVYAVEPYNILAVTFTNKAANEMKERIEKLSGSRANQINMGTFHGICSRILRKHIQLFDKKFNQNFTIIDTNGQKSKMIEALENVGQDKREWRDAQKIISNYKNDLLSPSEINNANNPLTYAHVYNEYQKLLVRDNSVDFDDLIFYTVRILEDYPQVREKFQQLYQYIHVDEYQDTNTAQYRLIKQLVSEKENITVVGDEDQSIYKFTGADIRNILNFQKDYKNAKSITLDTNYRSTKTIVDAAQQLILLNKERLSKEIQPFETNDIGDDIELVKFYDDKQEATFISKTIQSEVAKENYKYNEFMILYRTNSLSRVVEEAFIRYGIPYQIVGGTGFYDREEIRDILAYLQLSINLQDSVSFERIYNTPLRRFSKSVLIKIKDFADKTNMSLFQATLQINKINKAHYSGQDVSKYSDYILRESQSKVINNFLITIKKIFDKGQKESAYETMKYILEVTNYKKHIRHKYARDISKQLDKLSNIDELLTASLDYVENYDVEEDSPLEFMNFVSLVRNSGVGNKLTFDEVVTINNHTFNMEKIEDDILFSGIYKGSTSESYNFKIPTNIINKLVSDIKSMFASYDRGEDILPLFLSDILLEIIDEKFVMTYKDKLNFEFSFKDAQEMINYLSNISDGQSVKLMTMHSSKGLESPVVFIIGAEQGVTPHFFNMTNNLEEERRLFYVAMTRAEQLLFITHCNQRLINGRNQSSSRSQFIKEVPERFVNFTDKTR